MKKDKSSKSNLNAKNPEQIVEEADNLLKNRNVLTKISDKIWDNKAERLEKAGSMYILAANLFKVNKEWKKASFAYIKASGCYEKMKASLVTEERSGMCYQSGVNYMEAAENMKNVDVNNAVTLYERAIDSFLEFGNVYRAGKLVLEKSKLLEENQIVLNITLDNIINSYQKAEEYFEIDDKKYELIKVREKIAELLGLNKQYQECSELYEKMIEYVKDDSILKYRLNRYIIRFILCLICLDEVNRADNEILKFGTYNKNFRNTKEESFAITLVKAYENCDTVEIDRLLSDATFVEPNSWEKNILLNVRDSMKKIDNIENKSIKLEDSFDEEDLL